MLGFCPDDVSTAPAEAISFVARQLTVDPYALVDYGLRVQTRTDHANQVQAYLGFRSPSPPELEDVRDWLSAEALAQDRPITLFHLACQRLYELRLVRPGLTVIEQSLVGVAREDARRESARRVAPFLTDGRCALLDSVLAVDAKIGAARATWLRHFPVSTSPAVMHDEMDKLLFLQQLGAGDRDLGMLPARRRRTFAGWVQTASNQALLQSSPERRYPALLAFASERLVGITDGLVDLFDKLLADTNAKARRRLSEYQASIAGAANDKMLLLAEIARVLLDPDLDDDARLARLFETVQGPVGRGSGGVRADRPTRRLPHRSARRPLLPAPPERAPMAVAPAVPLPPDRRRRYSRASRRSGSSTARGDARSLSTLRSPSCQRPGSRSCSTGRTR
jgi:hypothetical protein